MSLLAIAGRTHKWARQDLDQRQVGDYRLSLYELTLGDHVYDARAGLAPDDRLSQC